MVLIGSEVFTEVINIIWMQSDPVHRMSGLLRRGDGTDPLRGKTGGQERPERGLGITNLSQPFTMPFQTPEQGEEKFESIKLPKSSALSQSSRKLI